MADAIDGDASQGTPAGGDDQKLSKNQLKKLAKMKVCLV